MSPAFIPGALAVRGGRAHPLAVDLARLDAVVRAVHQPEPIDVRVNDAGCGHQGILERSELDELRRQFDVNVFAAAAIIQAKLPRKRGRRSGRVVDINSIGGFITMPGIALHRGSKFALEEVSDARPAGAAPSGIHVTALVAGPATDRTGRPVVRSVRRRRPRHGDRRDACGSAGQERPPARPPGQSRAGAPATGEADATARAALARCRHAPAAVRQDRRDAGRARHPGAGLALDRHRATPRP